MQKVTLFLKRLATHIFHFVELLPDFFKRVRFRLSEITWARRLRKSVQGMRGRNQIERNIWYLYVEMFWAAIFMAAMAFNATPGPRGRPFLRYCRGSSVRRRLREARHR